MYIKGFDKNLRCRDMQFEIGKEYNTGAADTDIKLCTDTVFHFCVSLEKIDPYYSIMPEKNNRFCEIEVLGALVSDDNKCGSNHIRIVREILGEELNLMRGLTNGNTGLFNTGKWNSGSRNSGNFNSGDRNSGNSNSGDRNSGDFNSGVRNSGNFNNGSFNSGNYNFGFFCTNSSKINLFNKETDFTMEEFMKTKWYQALTSGEFNLTEWRPYTDKEKACDERKKIIGGELVTIPYKAACANYWNSLSVEDKAIIKTMPNFDANIFYEITGIDVINNQ